MKKSRQTKRTLIPSILAVIMCVAMLVGTTFAWFTDTASTSVNKIEAGKLDVDIQDNAGNSLNGKTLSFKDKNGSANILWEPGATFNLDSFKIVNKGNLALKYEIFVNGVSGNAKLLEAIEFKATVGGTETALNNLTGAIIPAGKTAGEGEVAGETGFITISGTMKKDAGNAYQGLSLDGIGITVVAEQYSYEYDSTGKTYDSNADATIQVNPQNIQDYLDGKYGSIDGATLVLAAGTYDKLELGRATKYEGSNTTYHVGSYDSDALTLEQLKATTSGARYYIRTMSNVTFEAAANATVTIAGIEMVSGHHTYDYVEEKSSNYYVANRAYNITFKGITFTARCYISGADSTAAVINGFTFKDCIFNINQTTWTNNNSIDTAYQAINFRCDQGKAAMRNLVVDRCEFYNCFQGVYTQNVYGVTVNNSKFNTTKHNAIAISHDTAAFNHGAVVITNNNFTNIGDRIIRFGTVLADTQITITGNTATNSGDGDAEVIKANSLAAGITYNISGNSWGTKDDKNTVVYNDELKNK